DYYCEVYDSSSNILF
nr:immunoglobulin light chain junction region [Macaca mulatta]MOX28223.1 immunoglobulin light chain junction region [Macaca mulatta]MOX28286.1 immunoglobulin light chain junction region [Macaca mulatta]MOX28454.1 immunoglobulin light chain junction region [Macaca mulatta]MOX28572.1 immunoglobulin light chain junction region [Macaca mulatta]